MNIIDCHTHTNNSPDGYCTVEAMCERAMECGLSAYAITDHCEVNDYYIDGYDKATDRSFNQITAAKEKYKNLNLICGVELGQANQDFETAEKIISDERLDYIIGSVHNLSGYQDFAFLDYPYEDSRVLLTQYYDEMLEICKWGKFDILGHLTYPLRYMVGEQGLEIDMKPYEEQIREIFRQIISHGKGIEINTSGLRQKYGKTFPDLYYIKMYKELGGEVLSLGSDAHKTTDLSKGIVEGAELAQEAGFKAVTYFKKRKPYFVDLD